MFCPYVLQSPNDKKTLNNDEERSTRTILNPFNNNTNIEQAYYKNL